MVQYWVIDKKYIAEDKYIKDENAQMDQWSDERRYDKE